MRLRQISFLICFVAIIVGSCKKDVKLGDPPYPPGEEPAYKFGTDRPVPARANAGTSVTYQIAGLKEKTGKFKFFISNVEAEITAVTDNTVTVKVPATAISGNASILIDGNYIFGPSITILGDVEIDPSFSVSGSRSNGPLLGLEQINNNSLYLYGLFTNYAGVGTTQVPIRGIVPINTNGAISGSIGNHTLSGAIQGNVNFLKKLSTGEYILAGGFSAFDTVPNVNGLALLSSTGTLQTKVVDVVNPDPVNDPSAGKDTVSALNAGVSGGEVLRVFETNDQKLIVVGNFEGYMSVFYDNSTKSSPYFDNILAPGAFKIFSDGTYDSTFNYDYATKRGRTGPNGKILDAIQLPNGDIIMVGNFTSYNGTAANRIVRLSLNDGSVNTNFSNLGGADGIINTIRYNANTGKILLAGTFGKYNGVPANGVVMINADGSIDNSFKFKAIEGGIVNFAAQINHHNFIVVSGSFTHYGGQVRPGLAILNPNGDLAAGFNNFGLFRGGVNNVLEVASSTGLPTLFLMGLFDRFDNLEVGNFLKLNFKN
ncbi:DUF5008 domain-containing protein [Niabella sp. CC-SYL272]|uniref:DUF5008 domain-containing protein n=1 Tax=Niabella agricola TaxID=2891571 RepID=UPI001F1CBCE1|nr:DUF5008 domain-containing protein [Niabella agricola]MCF3110396.1 DUF5008 domain-containing protein [Niabella agricola]